MDERERNEERKKGSSCVDDPLRSNTACPSSAIVYDTVGLSKNDATAQRAKGKERKRNAVKDEGEKRQKPTSRAQNPARTSCFRHETSRHDILDRNSQVHSTSDVDACPAERIKDNDKRQRNGRGSTVSKCRRELMKATPQRRMRRRRGRDGIPGTSNCHDQAYSSRATVEVPLARIKSTATVRRSKPCQQTETERGDVRDDQDESDRCYDVYSPSTTVEVPLSRIKSTAMTRQSRRRRERDGGTTQRTNERSK